MPERRPIEAARRPGMADLFRTARPKQWLKNLLVFSVPAAAGELGTPEILAEALLAFVAFTLVAVSTYFTNDLADIEGDARHPTKSQRPIARGAISPRDARVAAVVTLAGGLTVGALVDPLLGATLAGYKVLTVSYSLWLRKEPILDITVIASVFVLRAVAGGAATGLALSGWFLVVASFGALFVAACKRYSERLLLGENSAGHRGVLADYPDAFLRLVMSMAVGVAVVTYSLWAREIGDGLAGGSWLFLSVLPFTMSLMRYALVVLTGAGGGDPEEVMLRDRPMQVFIVLWGGLVAIGVYAG